jgi:hypothetical protein
MLHPAIRRASRVVTARCSGVWHCSTCHKVHGIMPHATCVCAHATACIMCWPQQRCYGLHTPAVHKCCEAFQAGKQHLHSVAAWVTVAQQGWQLQTRMHHLYSDHHTPRKADHAMPQYLPRTGDMSLQPYSRAATAALLPKPTSGFWFNRLIHSDRNPMIASTFRICLSG